MVTAEQSAANSTPRWTQEALDTLRLAWPIALTQLGQVAMMTSDLAMIGRLGDEAIAAASLAHAVLFTVFVPHRDSVDATHAGSAVQRGLEFGRRCYLASRFPFASSGEKSFSLCWDRRRGLLRLPIDIWWGLRGASCRPGCSSPCAASWVP